MMHTFKDNSLTREVWWIRFNGDFSSDETAFVVTLINLSYCVWVEITSRNKKSSISGIWLKFDWWLQNVKPLTAVLVIMLGWTWWAMSREHHSNSTSTSNGNDTFLQRVMSQTDQHATSTRSNLLNLAASTLNMDIPCWEEINNHLYLYYHLYAVPCIM